MIELGDFGACQDMFETQALLAERKCLNEMGKYLNFSSPKYALVVLFCCSASAAVIYICLQIQGQEGQGVKLTPAGKLSTWNAYLSSTALPHGDNGVEIGVPTYLWQ